ncbi:Hint domain-containing protein [Candidatus Rhodobacter oscarellae]|nr:Hint domain-containing protein [Candidatus Rhodobacter lobularis]
MAVATEIQTETPCYTPGSRIATPTGEVAVETLSVGDKVVTRDNGIQEIRWVGWRSIAGRELTQNPHLRPILIRKDALGDGLPERDMWLSPNHRVLVTSDQTALYFEDREVLVAAKHLVNHRGVHDVETLATTYIHFLFDRHEVVLADGCWSESFQPCDTSLRGIGNAQRQEIYDVFPELQENHDSDAARPARRILSKKETLTLFDQM